MATQIDASAGREGHALGLEQPPLPGSAWVRQADLAASVDDPLPGDLAARGQMSEHAADEAGPPGQTRELGDLAVAGDAAPGDRLDGAADLQPVGRVHATVPSPNQSSRQAEIVASACSSSAAGRLKLARTKPGASNMAPGTSCVP